LQFVRAPAHISRAELISMLVTNNVKMIRCSVVAAVIEMMRLHVHSAVLVQDALTLLRALSAVAGTPLS